MEEEKRTEKRNKSNKKTEVACVKFLGFFALCFLLPQKVERYLRV